MTTITQGVTRRWQGRTLLRPLGPAGESTLGKVFLGFAVASAVPLLVFGLIRPALGLAMVCVPFFLLQSLVRLVTTPGSWTRCAAWLDNRAPKKVYLLAVSTVGALLLYSLYRATQPQTGFLALSLALVGRAAVPLAEPTSYSLDEHPYAGRIRRAAFVHGGFMVMLAFGVAVSLHAVLPSAPATVFVGAYLTLTIASGGFFFKVHTNVRRVCTRTRTDIAEVRRLLAFLDQPQASLMALTAAVDALEVTLETSVEAGCRSWGRSITPEPIRTRVITWLRQRIADGLPVHDSTDPEYQALLAIEKACRKWNAI